MSAALSLALAFAFCGSLAAGRPGAAIVAGAALCGAVFASVAFGGGRR